MRVPLPTERTDGHTFRPILLANLLPLAGVLVLEWEASTLAFVYGLELLLSVLLAAGKALFAQRQPPADREEGVLTVSNGLLTDKRGSLEPVAWLPPIYLRNVPFALAVLTVLVMYGFFFGVTFVLIFQPGPELVQPAVALSIVVLFVGQLLETTREYVGERQYERVSPYAVVETPARQLFVLVFVLGSLGLLLESFPTAALVLVVCAKLFLEWSAIRAARADDETNRFVDRFARFFAGPDGTETAASEPEPLRVPDTEPQARVRPDDTTVVLEGVLLSVPRVAVFVPFLAVAWFVVLFALVDLLDSVAVFWLGVIGFVAVVLGVLAVRVGRYYLAYGTLEYQRHDDRIVVVDRVLEEPQWTASPADRRDVAVVNDRLADRVRDTRTFQLTIGWGDAKTERQIGPIAEPDRAVEALALPIETTALEPLNRSLAVGAVVLAAGIVLTAAAVLFVPGLPVDSRLEIALLLAFALLVPFYLWQRAYPTDE
ncbi:DUF6498-containing protein [Halobiforma nitratireducens]|uniref:Uncharacterized protein n=1 Tax=Halobiforma nitratireducens JCM 10879 TaxID=1227454 RepID=M0MHD2_9EURY|nr:DUF6498-containing protein [Halobiforma nitratireducens]EMA45137.1 hypothetical protein C446_02602 [Halobiforma nitratireducens JCM 10879]